MNWILTAQSYDGRYAMPILIWTLFLFVAAGADAVLSLSKRFRNFSLNRKTIFVLVGAAWTIHGFLIYYTAVNLYAFRHYTSPLGMKAAEHEQLYFELSAPCLQMAIVSSVVLLMLSFVLCTRPRLHTSS